MSGSRPLVSIVIVLYNCEEYIGDCIASLASLGYSPFEIVLVDNASDDSSVEVGRRSAVREGLPCIISRLQKNRGFAAANNRGVELSGGEIVFMLNPDTEVYPDILDRLVDAMESDERIGLAGCKILYPDRKTLQHAGGYIRDNGLTMHYGADEADAGQYDERRDVAYVTGAAMAIRRELFLELGGLDEGFFPAYFEETDLCVRVRRAGYRVTYIPDAKLLHHESTTTGKYSRRFLYLYHRNRIRFLLKHFSWRFLLERTLPFEQQWVQWIPAEKEAVPLNKAYLVNLLTLPGTLIARHAMEKRLCAPRIEDTVTLEETKAEIGL